ncbi:MAG: hypothetical protein L0H03_19340, partial [Rhodococcus sp. (in: high G+C Gram-positive bacteria)]|nr:hypothetical protein [Rhodococcus sp. (in: high G+C Gram-positive bacteria)]
MTAAVRDLVDELDALDLADLARLASPCLSVYLPTGRTHHDAGRAPLELRALLDEAREDLSDDRRDLAGPAFDRAASLVGDKRFWNEQG